MVGNVELCRIRDFDGSHLGVQASKPHSEKAEDLLAPSLREVADAAKQVFNISFNGTERPGLNSCERRARVVGHSSNGSTNLGPPIGAGPKPGPTIARASRPASRSLDEPPESRGDLGLIGGGTGGPPQPAFLKAL